MRSISGSTGSHDQQQTWRKGRMYASDEVILHRTVTSTGSPTGGLFNELRFFVGRVAPRRLGKLHTTEKVGLRFDHNGDFYRPYMSGAYKGRFKVLRTSRLSLLPLSIAYYGEYGPQWRCGSHQTKMPKPCREILTQ